MISLDTALSSLESAACDPAELLRRIDAATTKLSRDLARYVGPVMAFTELHSGGRTGGPGHSAIWLHNTPLPDSVETPITVEIRDYLAATFAVATAGSWFVDGYTLHSTSRWPAGPATVRVTYSAGYPLDGGPAELRDLVLQMVTGRIRDDAAGGKQTETLGDYSYTHGETQRLTSYDATISRWRRAPV